MKPNKNLKFWTYKIWRNLKNYCQKNLHWLYYSEEVNTDLKQQHSTKIVTIKDQLSPFSNHNQEKYLGHTLIFPGHQREEAIMDSKLEMAIHLFFHSETILILFNLNAWINQKKYIIIKIGWLISEMNLQ